jgi:very-short-patch-repair endonuclease
VKTIYVAGKVSQRKWKILPHHQYVTYVASDGSGHSEHGWKMACYAFNHPDLRERVTAECTPLLNGCDALIAYLDTCDSFGSIAEVAYVSALGKPCVLIINVTSDEEYPNDPVFDTYWLVSYFPNVTTYVVHNVEEARECAQRVVGSLVLESPIERLFWDAYIIDSPTELPIPQYELLDYRLDFAFPNERVAVELDGQEFHSTVAQRTADAKRDRALLGAGWITMRFAGTEVFRNTASVISEVRELVLSKHAQGLMEA